MIKKLFAILLLLFGIGSMSLICAEQTNHPYYIEDNDGNYNVWTKVSIPANGQTTLYIKKTNGYIPNGNDVFELYDDFDGNSLDTSKWTAGSPGQVYMTSGYVHITPGSSNRNNYIVSNQKLSGGVLHIKLRTKTDKLSATYFGYDESHTSYNRVNGIVHSVYLNTGAIAVDGSNKNNFFTPDTSWHTYTIKINGNQMICDIDGTKSASTNIYELQRYVKVYQMWSDYTDVDYIYVCKYANEEPIVSTEKIKDSLWKITIHNPNNVDLTDFQVKIPGNGIVSSKTDSLLIVDNYIGYTVDTQNQWKINIKGYLSVIPEYIPKGKIIYVDWGDGQIDSQIYNGGNIITFQHTYTETGTYNIQVKIDNTVKTKTIQVVRDLQQGTLTFKPLYNNITVSGWAIVNGMNVSMAKNTTVYGVVGEPVKIQTDKGYITSIPFFSTMTAYVAGNEYQYVTVSLSADNPITVKNGDKIVGYGKNVFITQPVGDIITVYMGNEKIREYVLKSSIDDYIYIPKQHITANIKENNGILVVYLETWRKEKLHIQVENNNTAIYETEGYYEGFQRIDTGITPESGTIYKLTILNEDGNVVSYSTYTYAPETQKPDIPESEGYIWIAFLIGAVIMVMGVIIDNLPIALLGVGLFVLLVPYRMPYLDHLAAISTALAIIIIISRHIKRNAGD